MDVPYLIDGHNVIAALPDIDLEDEYDEAKLVLKLRAWTGRKRRKAIVIFDGGIPGGYARALSTPSIKVIFAARHHTNADRIIRERVRCLRDAGNWTIVSSDREVMDNARNSGAKVLSAQAFVEQLTLSQATDKEKPETISAAEVEEWLQVFHEVPTTPPPASPALPQPPKAARRQQAQSRTAAPAPTLKPRRHIPPNRGISIGEQVGLPPAPEKSPPRPHPPRTAEGKPDTVSDAELAAWLEVFPEPQESYVPPPNLPKRKAARRRPVTLTINKEMAHTLAQDEIETWLELFGGEPEPVPPAPLAADPPAQTSQPRRNTRRWAKYKHKQAPASPADTSAEPDDADLFRQMFGEGE